MKARLVKSAVLTALLAAVSFPIGTSAHSGGQSSNSDSGAALGSVHAADRHFVAELLEEATTQLAFARFAAQHASATAIRSAAADEAELWSTMLRKLAAIAGSLDVPMPHKLDKIHRTTFDAFVRLDGKAFDNAFIRIASRENQTAFDDMARLDPVVSSKILFFVDDTLPQIGEAQKELGEQLLSPS
jgi:hypothetical protein